MDLKDDILFQLGSPVVEIELDANQLDYSIARAERWWSEQEKITRGGDVLITIRERKIRSYAVATATMILGRIRSKYTVLPGSGTGGDSRMDGEILLSDARMRFEALSCGPYG